MCEPVWPSGKAHRLVRRTCWFNFPFWFSFTQKLGFMDTGSISHFGSLFYSKVGVYERCLVTLALKINETLKWFLLLPIIMQSHSGSDSSVQGGICVLGKAHMHSTLSLRSFPNVTFETVPMFGWLTMALPCPFKEDRLALPLSIPLSSRWS